MAKKEDILLRPAPKKLLLIINGKEHLSGLAKKSGVTFSHTCKVINIMQVREWIVIKTKKHKRYPELTSKGAVIRDHIASLEEHGR